MDPRIRRPEFWMEGIPGGSDEEKTEWFRLGTTNPPGGWPRAPPKKKPKRETIEIGSAGLPGFFGRLGGHIQTQQSTHFNRPAL